jgi:uracil-DNA glycosylase
MNDICISNQIGCVNFPCSDVDHQGYLIPSIRLNPEKIKLVLISESPPPDPKNDYYAGDEAQYSVTTRHAFTQAGVQADSINKLLRQGIYFTTAIKCAKTSYAIATGTVNKCSHILEKELSLFLNARTFLLMGDVAIKAINAIARRQTGKRAIPAEATYKIRRGEFYLGNVRIFPSYLQVGPSYGIEKSKQRMIAEDISKAITLIANS